MQKSYALFDFDGTLRKGDSIVSLCLYAHRRKLCTTGQLLKGIAYAAGYGLHLCSAERAKAAALYKRYCLPVTGRPAIPLPSTSPANCRVTLDGLTEAYRAILAYI